MERRAKLAHVTTVHQWDDVRIFHKMCKSLARAGYEVSLVAPVQWDFSAAGVNIYGFRKCSPRVLRILIHPLLAYGVIHRLRPDVVHLHDPELLPIGLLMQLLGYKIVFDSHEDYPEEIQLKHWLPRVLRKPLSFAAKLITRMAGSFLSGVVAATSQIAIGFGEGRAVVVRNFPVLEEIAPAEGAPFPRRPERFAYVGTMTLERGTFEMVEAIRLLRERVPDSRLVLAGKMDPPDLRLTLEAQAGWSAVDYHSWLERGAVCELLSSVCGGLVILQPEPALVVSLPIKLFEYMAAGLPVIASDFALWRELLGERDCVLFVDPTDPGKVAEAMAWLIDHPQRAEAMGRRGRAAVLSEFNWSSEERSLLTLYERILGGPTAS